MKRGWRIFLKVLTLGIVGGSKFAKRPNVVKGLNITSEMLEQLDDADSSGEDPTPSERPRGKGLR